MQTAKEAQLSKQVETQAGTITRIRVAYSKLEKRCNTLQGMVDYYKAQDVEKPTRQDTARQQAEKLFKESGR